MFSCCSSFVSDYGESLGGAIEGVVLDDASVIEVGEVDDEVVLVRVLVGCHRDNDRERLKEVHSPNYSH